jgi:hypothetical protein
LPKNINIRNLETAYPEHLSLSIFPQSRCDVNF